MAKVNINDVLQGLIQPIGSLKGGSTYPVTAADQIWVYKDHDTHRPLDEYLDAIKTEAAETTQTFVSNATALTDGNIAKTSIVGGNAAKCKVGDIVLVADGNIYKISAIGETNITLALPALASYATAASLPKNRVLHGDLKDATGAPSYPSGGSGGGVSPTLNLLDISEDSATVRTTITQTEKDNLDKGLYNQILYFPSTNQMFDMYAPSKLFSVDGQHGFIQFNIDMSNGALAVKNLSLYAITLGAKDTSGNYPITIEKQMDINVGNTSRLNLVDVNSDDLTPRTSITEEERINLAYGVYHSILYVDPSLGDGADYSLYFPENVLSLDGGVIFSIYKVAITDDAMSIVSTCLYSLAVSGEKNSDGTYPIAIEKIQEVPFGSRNNQSAGTGPGDINIITKGAYDNSFRGDLSAEKINILNVNHDLSVELYKIVHTDGTVISYFIRDLGSPLTLTVLEQSGESKTVRSTTIGE